MGASTFIMVLIGCAAGGQQCAPIATLPMAYRSESSCLGARTEILAASLGLGYHRVIAECRARGASAGAAPPVAGPSA